MTDPYAPDLDHPTESQLVDLVAGDLEQAHARRVADHARACLLCGSLLDLIGAGLVGAGFPELPDADAVAGTLAGTEGVAESVLATVARADRPKSGPRPGELWRARAGAGGPVTLVWVRARTPKATVVVPVSFDTGHADEYTVIVTEDASPLGLPLALHVAVESTIDAGTLLDRLGVLDAEAAVDAVTATRSVGARPDTNVGPSISSALDERIEYRQALAARMATLAPAGAEQADADGEQDDADGEQDDWWLLDDPSPVGALLAAVHTAVGEAHPRARIVPRTITGAMTQHLDAIALVTELDAFVLLAVVDPDVDGRVLLESAREVLHADQLLDAVCLVESSAPYMSVVIDRRDVVDAIETPSGELRSPRQSRPAALVGDALTKFLDATISPFGRLAGTVVEGHVIDPHDLAVDVSAEAVRAVRASARGYKVQGKRPGYERVDRHRDAIIRLIEAALTGADVDVAAGLEDDT